MYKYQVLSVHIVAMSERRHQQQDRDTIMANTGKTTKRVALYLRVSTDEQTTDNQRLVLAAVAQRSGWEVVEVYEDHGISGATGRDKRPALDKLMQDATRRRFDIVAAWSIDRMGRSVHTVSAIMAELEALGIAQYYQQQAIDTMTPSGKAMVQMCLVFSELERGMMQERIKAGLSRAKANGTKSGKAIGRPRVTEAVEQAVLRLRAEGKGIRKIAREVGIGTGTVQRLVNVPAASA